jgi:hypothetical protein
MAGKYNYSPEDDTLEDAPLYLDFPHYVEEVFLEDPEDAEWFHLRDEDVLDFDTYWERKIIHVL